MAPVYLMKNLWIAFRKITAEFCGSVSAEAVVKPSKLVVKVIVVRLSGIVASEVVAGFLCQLLQSCAYFSCVDCHTFGLLS